MSLIMYVYHYCEVDEKPCCNGSKKECPEAIGDLVPWCKHFMYRGPEDDAKREAEQVRPNGI